MNKIVFILAVICASVACTNFLNSEEKLTHVAYLFDKFNKQHGKTDKSFEDFAKRMSVFAENVVKHAQFIHFVGEEPFFSPFFDVSEEEFSKRLNFKPDYDFYGKLETLNLNDPTPDVVDWREKGIVNKVKDQKQCGSCWAFSAVGNIESINAIVNGNLVSLSEQQIVDCDVDSDDEGCNGGWMHSAMDYVIDQGGIQSDKDYPYTGRDDDCKFNKNLVKVKLNGYHKIDENEDALKIAVATVGPISVAVNASLWQFYFGGIFILPCSSSLNHGVLVVGYGTANGIDYWIIKNSWSSSWGEAGYIRLARNRGQLCGISTYNVTAHVKKN